MAVVESARMVMTVHRLFFGCPWRTLVTLSFRLALFAMARVVFGVFCCWQVSATSQRAWM